MATNGMKVETSKSAKNGRAVVCLKKRATAEEIIRKVGGGRVYLKKLEQIKAESKKPKGMARQKAKA